MSVETGRLMPLVHQSTHAVQGDGSGDRTRSGDTPSVQAVADRVRSNQHPGALGAEKFSHNTWETSRPDGEELPKRIRELLGTLHEASAEHGTWTAVLWALAGVLGVAALELCVERRGRTLRLGSSDTTSTDWDHSQAAPSQNGRSDAGDSRANTEWDHAGSVPEPGGGRSTMKRLLRVHATDFAALEIVGVPSGFHWPVWTDAFLAQFERAVATYLRELDHRAMTHWLMEESDAVPYGRLIVDQALAILYGNRAAFSIADETDGIEIVDRRLVARRPRDRVALQCALKATELAGSTSVITVPRPSGRWPYVMRVRRYECGSDHDVHWQGRQFEIIVLDRGRASVSVDPMVVCGAGLTRTEERALLALVRGLTIEDIAQDLGVVRGTAKLHVNHLLKKLGVHRQAELIQKMFVPFHCALPEASVADSTIDIGKARLPRLTDLFPEPR